MAREAPDLFHELQCNLWGQGGTFRTKSLVDIALGRARAVGDDRGHHPGAIAAILLVDVLDHLLAPFVLEVDVDIRRLAALDRDEALEEEIHPDRIDRRDPETEADRGVRGRPAP